MYSTLIPHLLTSYGVSSLNKNHLGPDSIWRWHLTGIGNPIWRLMILRPSYLHNGISYTVKTTSLYWIRALGILRNSVFLCKVTISAILNLQKALHLTLMDNVWDVSCEYWREMSPRYPQKCTFFFPGSLSVLMTRNVFFLARVNVSSYDQLIAMGFPKGAAAEALRQSNNDITQSIQVRGTPTTTNCLSHIWLPAGGGGGGEFWEKINKATTDNKRCTQNNQWSWSYWEFNHN